MTVLLVDVEGALKVALEAVPGLAGVGNPLAGGVSIHGDRRSPAAGAYALLDREGSGTADERRDLAFCSLRVRAVGNHGGRGAAEAAARAVAVALDGLRRVTVTTRRGERVLIVACADTTIGYAGQAGGEAEYRVATSVVAQPA